MFLTMRINGGLQNCLNTDWRVFDVGQGCCTAIKESDGTLDKLHKSSSDTLSSFSSFLPIWRSVDLQTSGLLATDWCSPKWILKELLFNPAKQPQSTFGYKRARMMLAREMWAVDPLHCLGLGGDSQGLKHFSDNIIIFSKFSTIDLCLIQRIVILRLKAAIKIKSSRVYIRMISNFNWSLSFSSFILIWWDFPFFK